MLQLHTYALEHWGWDFFSLNTYPDFLYSESYTVCIKWRNLGDSQSHDIIYSFSKIYKHVLAKVGWKINMTRTIKPMTRSNPHPACIPPFLLFLYSLYHSKKANLEYRVFKNDLQNQNCQDYYKQENISLV